jgi:putative transposase
MATERVQEKRQFGHRAQLALTPAQVRLVDAQAHTARTMWNLLHDWWTMLPKGKHTLALADAAIRGRAKAPKFKARFRSVMSVDVPHGRDLHIKRVHRRWGVRGRGALARRSGLDDVAQ